METFERIRELRTNHLKMSQTAFGEHLGVNRDVINNIENNRLSRPEQKLSLYKLICSEFNVNEEWLLNGTEPMFVEPDAFSLDECAKARGATDLELEIMKAYFELDVDIRKAVVEHFKTKLRIATDANPALLVPDSPEELEKLYPPVETGKDESNKSDVG